MEPVIIEPSVGRIVWYYDLPDAKAQAAIVCYVHDTRKVNLAVFSHTGVQTSYERVTLVQDGDEIPKGGRYASWMPFQIQSAQKRA